LNTDHPQESRAMPTKEELYDEAIRLQQQGNVEEAVGKLQEVVAEHPDYALAHAALSKFLSDLERHDQAVEHAQKVCELDPDDPFSFDAMSLICQKAGRLMEAEQALRGAWQVRVAAQRSPSE
jgi:Flp pilus assembly protein TadD